MTLKIRRATPSDWAAIACIAVQAFDERLVSDWRSLGTGLVLVAELADKVAGFVGSFLTRSASGERRFELDLLAVDISARGRGAATALISRSMSQAPLHEADMIRGLVRHDNHAMQRILQRAGLVRSDSLFRLFVESVQATSARAGGNHAAHLVPVDTLTYRGIWLEGDLCAEAINCARQMAVAESRTRIGAVIPAENKETAALLRESGFSLVGDYHWWTVNLRGAQS